MNVWKVAGAVRHPEGHDEVFVRAVTGPESRLPFVSFSDADVVVSGSEIDFGVDAGGAKAIKKVADEGDRIAVLLGDTIESAIVEAKPEGSVFLLREEDGGAGGRVGGTDEAFSEHVIKVFTNGFELGFGHIVDRTMRGARSFLDFNVMVVGTMRGHGFGFRGGEDVGIVVVFFRDIR